MAFTVVTYNLLADCHARPEKFPGVPAEHLGGEQRLPRLIEQVVHLGADVLCLQEVDAAVFGAVASRLQPLGYWDLFAPKTAGPLEGVATFVRTSAFTVHNKFVVNYRDATADQPATGHLALVLLLEKDGRLLYLANTHLRHDPPGTPAERRRALIEVRQLLAERATMVDTPTWIVAGDLNSTPASEVVAELRAAGLEHAYRDREGVTTFHGPDGEALVDYLFHTPDLTATPHDLPQFPAGTTLPSAEQPSDHLPVRATFDWR
jgi:mRNA deadenylase 3'-5' endonuclease subunit Ccr4